MQMVWEVAEGSGTASTPRPPTGQLSSRRLPGTLALPECFVQEAALCTALDWPLTGSLWGKQHACLQAGDENPQPTLT